MVWTLLANAASVATSNPYVLPPPVAVVTALATVSVTGWSELRICALLAGDTGLGVLTETEGLEGLPHPAATRSSAAAEARRRRTFMCMDPVGRGSAAEPIKLAPNRTRAAAANRQARLA